MLRWVELVSLPRPLPACLLQLKQILVEQSQTLRRFQQGYLGQGIMEQVPLMGPALRELVGYSAQLELQQLRRTKPVSRMSRRVQHS